MIYIEYHGPFHYNRNHGKLILIKTDEHTTDSFHMPVCNRLITHWFPAEAAEAERSTSMSGDVVLCCWKLIMREKEKSDSNKGCFNTIERLKKTRLI